METAEVYRQLTGILRSVFDDNFLLAKPELTAADIDGWDSLSHIRLVVTVERTFGVKFSASEIGHLKNVGEFAELIRKKVA